MGRRERTDGKGDGSPMKIVLLESLGISDELLATYAKKLEEKGH